MVIEECALRSARCDRVILRNGDAVERVFGMLPVAARDPGPAQACVVARFDTVNTSGDPLVGIDADPPAAVPAVDPDFTGRLGL
jgi:hypothetical protein